MGGPEFAIAGDGEPVVFFPGDGLRSSVEEGIDLEGAAVVFEVVDDLLAAGVAGYGSREFFIGKL